MLRNTILSMLLLVSAAMPSMAQDAKQELMTLRDETRTDLLENILPFWENHCVDPSWGFYGTVSREGIPDASSQKGGVLNARILWAFSYAYRIFGKDIHKKLAQRAFESLDSHFLDKEYGGLIWLVESDGTIKDASKQVSSQTYAIYGLSEYYRATGDKRGLDRAIELYRLVEDKGCDKVKGGYFENFTRDWKRSSKPGEGGRAAGSAKGAGTCFHLIEAYKSLYDVWPDKGLRERITDIVRLMTEKMVNRETGHLLNGLDEDLNSTDDMVFYGHDAETSWLLTDAAKVIKDRKLRKKALETALTICDAELRDGVMKDGAVYMMQIKGKKMGTGWWCQTETILSAVNAYRITGDRKYLDAARLVWSYIKDYYIDKEYGEWFRTCLPDGKPVKTEPKCSMWNCPYHSCRLGAKLAEWLGK